MIRIAALNASDSSDSVSADNAFNASIQNTKEAQEHAAHMLYNKGLSLQRLGKLAEAEQMFKQVLDNPFVTQRQSETAEGEALQPGAMLKYSSHKNIANIAALQDRHDDAVESLLEAVSIDSTDVTVWYRLGIQAKKINHLQLSCKAFSKGLQCSSNHWPCLDGLITMLYATNNYDQCLALIAQSFMKDPGYVKGLAIRKAIYEEQPSLQDYNKHYFTNCDMASVEKYTSELEPDEIAEYVDEVKVMREKRKLLIVKKTPALLPLKLKDVSWIGLGKRIIELYEYIEKVQHDTPELTIWRPVDMLAPADCDDSSPVSDKAEVQSIDPSQPENIAEQVNPSVGETSQQTCSDQVVTEPVVQSSSDNEQRITTELFHDVQVMEVDSTSKPDNISSTSSLSVNSGSDFKQCNEEITNLPHNATSSTPAVTSHTSSEAMETESITPVPENCSLLKSDQLITNESDQSHEKELQQEASGDQEQTHTERKAIEIKLVDDTASLLPASTGVDTRQTQGIQTDHRQDENSLNHQMYDSSESCADVFAVETNDGQLPVPTRVIDTPPFEVYSNSSQEADVFAVETSDGQPPVPTRVINTPPFEICSNSSREAAGILTHESTCSQSLTKPNTLGEVFDGSSEELAIPLQPLLMRSHNESSRAGDESQPSSAQESQHSSNHPSAGAESICSMLENSQQSLSQEAPRLDVNLQEEIERQSVRNARVEGQNMSQPDNFQPAKLSELSQRSLDAQPSLARETDSQLSSVTESQNTVFVDDKSAEEFQYKPLPLSSNERTVSPTQLIHKSAAITESICTDDDVSALSFSDTETAIVELTIVEENTDAPADCINDVVPFELTGDADLAINDGKNKSNDELELLPSTVQASGSCQSVLSDHQYAKPSSDMPAESNRKGVKRKKSTGVITAQDIEKRRSARVRSTTAKKLKVIEEVKQTFKEMLEKLIPVHLLSVQNTPRQDTNSSSSEQPEKLASEIKKPVPSTFEAFANEREEINAFINNWTSNQGVGGLLEAWLFAVCKKMAFVWPAELAELYVKIFILYRRHIVFPNCFIGDGPEEFMHNLSKAALLWIEFSVDSRMRENNIDDTGSNTLLEKDIQYWVTMSNWSKQIGVFWPVFCIRLYWAKAKFNMLRSKSHLAMSSYQQLLEFLTVNKDFIYDEVIELVNCSYQSIVSEKIVREQMEALKRSQSLEEIQNLHGQGEYSRVIDLLLPTFDRDENRKINMKSRSQQLLIFVEALLQVAEYPDALLCAVKAAHEAWNHYKNGHVKEEWSKALCNVIDGVSKLMTDKRISVLSSHVKAQLCVDMVEVIELCMASPEAEKSPPISTLNPWVILYHLIHQEETPISEQFSEMPASIELINFAHAQLGMRSWCTLSSGVVLHLLVKRLNQQLGTKSCSSAIRSDVLLNIEQCFYCLYGHPNKKARAKHLEDHEVGHVSLLWENMKPLFDYFKPKSVPEFDSYKSSTVSAELEYLLKRITAVVPTSEQPPADVEQVITAYLDREVPLSAVSNLSPLSNCEVTGQLYYLLADYYFKNKEPIKAIKHYQTDICYNPGRFDSWAGMALSKSCRLETRLGIMELQTYDGAFQKLVISTLQSFKRALDLNPDNGKLWIEFGSSAYQVHSYASRFLKFKEDDITSSELLTYTKLKADMLGQAYTCFTKACDVDDEDSDDTWLHHYMLGKIAEKLNKPASVYLDQYKRSYECLHDNGAQYPKKISYMYNPPHLAVESLEMHYRIHASILKSLVQCPAKAPIRVYKQALENARKSPFATALSETDKLPVSTKRTRSLSESDTTVRKMAKFDLCTVVPKSASSSPVIASHGGIQYEQVKTLMVDLLARVESAVSGENTNSRQKKGFLKPSQEEDITAHIRVNAETQSDVRVDESVVEWNTDMQCDTVIVKECLINMVDTVNVMTSMLDKITTSRETVESENYSKEAALSLNECTSVSENERALTAEQHNLPNTENLSRQAVTEECDIEEIMSTAQWRELIEECVQGLKLCIQRYPLHYKSYYRLAQLYCKVKQFKDSDKVHDLLMGSTTKKKEEKFVVQGLFQDRKHNNFFNGVWRIPIQEIERAGSFGTHLYRTIHLLLGHLHDLQDYNLLYHLHNQLQRNPGSEKKFLKDADRLLLSTLALEYAVRSFYKAIGKMQGSSEAVLSAILQQTFKWYKYGVKANICVPNVQVLLIKAYKTYKQATDPAYDPTRQYNVNDAKELCNKLMAKSKDKAKVKDTTSDTTTSINTTKPDITTKVTVSLSTLSKESVTKATGPGTSIVRGSFTPFSPDKSTKKPPPEKESTSVVEKTPKVLPATSWLHKAITDGAQSIASMFERAAAHDQP